MSKMLDPKLQFKIFDMIDSRPVEVVDQIDKEKFKFSEQKVKELCEDKIDYLIVDDMFEGKEEWLLKAREEGIMMTEKGQLKEAGYGRGEEYQKNKKVRGD